MEHVRFNFALVLQCIIAVSIVTQTALSQGSALNVKNSSGQSLLLVKESGKVRIGTGTDTSATLSVTGNDGFVATGLYGSGTPLSLGAGTRLMWYPQRGAFRAGFANSTEWDDAHIGDISVGLGFGTTASGFYSTAMGYATTASFNFSTAMGCATTASGETSTAMGNSTTASGMRSTAMGSETIASGIYSTAIGIRTTASGGYSTAMGYYVSTDQQGGSFILGDTSATLPTTSSAPNEMTMRFAGGYRLFSDRFLTTGVYMNGGTSGWTNYCDRNRKENFRPVDGEQLLLRIRLLAIDEWNYKGTDPSIRYIGPVAQDFYAAFKLGGGDSLGINSICIDGVNIAAIQALEKRTAHLRETTSKLASLQQRVDGLEMENAALRSKLQAIEQAVERLCALSGQGTQRVFVSR